MSVSLKNVLEPSMKLINVPESQPLSTHLLNILCDDRESALGLVTGVRQVSGGKALGTGVSCCSASLSVQATPLQLERVDGK